LTVDLTHPSHHIYRLLLYQRCLSVVCDVFFCNYIACEHWQWFVSKLPCSPQYDEGALLSSSHLRDITWLENRIHFEIETTLSLFSVRLADRFFPASLVSVC
jgi:hypothetical protein